MLHTMNLRDASRRDLGCVLQRALASVNDALLASVVHLESDGVDHFLETIVRHAVEIVDASAGWFTLPSADETQLKLVGALKRDVNGGGLVPIELAERTIPLTGFAGEVWAATKSADELYWQRLDQRRIPAKLRCVYQQGKQEALRVPIRFGGTTLGMLSLIFWRQSTLCETGVHVARMLGQHAALAMGMQHLREKACEATRRAVIDAERARMAGEIHDGLAQAFLTVIIHARAARLGGPSEKKRLLMFLEEIESIAARGLEEARRSVFALRSAAVEHDGLVRALERLVGSLSIAGRTQFVFINHVGAPVVDPSVEDTIYRIVQEATQNALKHADAQLVVVRLERVKSRLRVRIEDDGESVARDVIQSARERGGLRAMRECAEGCGGSFAIETRSPRGTRVDVLLPMKESSCWMKKAIAECA